MINKSILDQLQRISAKDGGVYLKNALSAIDIKTLGDQVVRGLGEELPSGYPDLLAVTNGVQINNTYISDGKTFLEENTDLRAKFSEYRDYLVLGHQGNMDHYVFNKQNKRFEVVNIFHPGEVAESFESLEVLLGYLLESQELA